MMRPNLPPRQFKEKSICDDWTYKLFLALGNFLYSRYAFWSLTVYLLLVCIFGPHVKALSLVVSACIGVCVGQMFIMWANLQLTKHEERNRKEAEAFYRRWHPSKENEHDSR